MCRFIISLAAALATTSMAMACLNDSELKDHEREFRSTYNRGTEPEKSHNSWSSNSAPIALFSGGSIFVIAAGVIVARRVSPKQ